MSMRFAGYPTDIFELLIVTNCMISGTGRFQLGREAAHYPQCTSLLFHQLHSLFLDEGAGLKSIDIRAAWQTPCIESGRMLAGW